MIDGSDWNSGYGYDCDYAASFGGAFGGQIGGIGAGGLVAAIALGETTTPATWEMIVPTVAAIGGAADLGHEAGHAVGALAGFGACEATNSFMDWLTAAPAPADIAPGASPSVDPGTASGGWITTVFDFTPGFDSGSSNHGDHGSNHHAEAGTSSHDAGHASAGEV